MQRALDHVRLTPREYIENKNSSLKAQSTQQKVEQKVRARGPGMRPYLLEMAA